jgi:hypothetical protein
MEFEVYNVNEDGDEDYFASSTDLSNIMYYAEQLDKYIVYKVTREILVQTT